MIQSFVGETCTVVITFSKHTLQKQVGCFNYTVVTRVIVDDVKIWMMQ